MLIKGKYMMSKLVKLTEIREHTHHWRSQEKFYELREILVNSGSVVLLHEDEEFKEKIKDLDKWPAGLHEKSIFTKIHLNGSAQSSPLYVRVVGNLEIVSGKLEGA